MNKYVFLLIAMFFRIGIYAQEDNMTSERKIQLSAYMLHTEDVSLKECRFLEDKIKRMISRGGMVDASGGRFIVTSHIIEHSNQLSPGSVVNMYVCELEITFYMGDAIVGNLFSSYGVEAKGFGETPEQARYEALRQINFNDPSFKRFIDKGKKRIVEMMVEDVEINTTGEYNFNWW